MKCHQSLVIKWKSSTLLKDLKFKLHPIAMKSMKNTGIITKEN